jgi:hypothetical protein
MLVGFNALRTVARGLGDLQHGRSHVEQDKYRAEQKHDDEERDADDGERHQMLRVSICRCRRRSKADKYHEPDYEDGDGAVEDASQQTN